MRRLWTGLLRDAIYSQSRPTLGHLDLLFTFWRNFLTTFYKSMVVFGVNLYRCMSSVSSRRIRVNDVTLHCEITGTGDHSLLLLPGVLGRQNVVCLFSKLFFDNFFKLSFFDWKETPTSRICSLYQWRTMTFRMHTWMSSNNCFIAGPSQPMDDKLILKGMWSEPCDLFYPVISYRLVCVRVCHSPVLRQNC